MLRAIAMALVLTGCASETVLRVPETAPVEMRVTWVRGTSDEVAFYCQGVSARLRALSAGRPGPEGAVACTRALPISGECVIYTTRDVTLETIGDELAHCYLGAWHH